MQVEIKKKILCRPCSDIDRRPLCLELFSMKKKMINTSCCWENEKCVVVAGQLFWRGRIHVLKTRGHSVGLSRCAYASISKLNGELYSGLFPLVCVLAFYNALTHVHILRRHWDSTAYRLVETLLSPKWTASSDQKFLNSKLCISSTSQRRKTAISM